MLGFAYSSFALMPVPLHSTRQRMPFNAKNRPDALGKIFCIKSPQRRWQKVEQGSPLKQEQKLFFFTTLVLSPLSYYVLTSLWWALMHVMMMRVEWLKLSYAHKAFFLNYTNVECLPDNRYFKLSKCQIAFDRVTNRESIASLEM